MTPIPNHDGYFADELGNIFSMRPHPWNDKPPTEPRKLKPWIDSEGRYRVTLCDGKRKHKRKVSHLILETFKGACPEGMEACHDPDNNQANNAFANLRWDTHKNNEADKIKHGTSQHGERNHESKLTEGKVENARWFCALYGRGSRAFLGKVWGINPTNISRAVDRKTWKHVLVFLILFTVGANGQSAGSPVLLFNANFELGATVGWNVLGSNTTNWIATERGFNSVLAAKLKVGDSASVINFTNDDFILPGRYFLRFAAFSTGGHDLRVGKVVCNLTESWQEFAVTIRIADDHFAFQLGGFAQRGDVYWIDEVRLIRLSGGGTYVPEIIRDADVGSVKVYNILSQEIDTPLRSGVYFYQFRVNGVLQTKKVVLVR